LSVLEVAYAMVGPTTTNSTATIAFHIQIKR
jgi:hypothetical protein